MKKSLILSIVMTLVLVISMSTATFAWYTANSNVTANINTITAASASGDLQIAITGEDAETPANPYAATKTIATSTTFAPIAPAAVLEDETDMAAAATWTAGSIKSGSFVAGTAAPATQVLSVEITLSNASSDATGEISYTITPTGDLKDYTEVAIYNGTTLVYSSTYKYGTAGTATGTADEVKNNIAPIAGGGSVTLMAYIWFDGYDMTNSQMKLSANVAIDFTAAA